MGKYPNNYPPQGGYKMAQYEQIGNWQHLQPNGNVNHQIQKKKSGAKESLIREGKSKGLIAITAWNSSKNRGFLTLKAFQNSSSTLSTSEKGNDFVSLVVEVFYERTGNTVIETANYNLRTGKMFLDKLNMVVSTKAANGGYFGTAKR